MKQPYTTPTLTAYGSVEHLTGIFGNPSTNDVQFDLSGDVTHEGTGSTDECPTQDRDTCFYPDR